MKFNWWNSVFPIAAIFSFRMLGLFMLIPVFTIYASQLSYSTPTLIGIALGSYGLSQGLLQIPFGMLSDRYGRKRCITIGLLFFAAGSLLGAATNSIYGMILARIIQGMGAIGAVLIALLSDLTPDTERTKSMAVIGATIGLSFSLAMIVSPLITQYFGLSGIFYLTALLALLGLVLLHGVIPNPKKEPFHVDSETNGYLFKSVLTNMQLQRLNVSIFMQHLILTASFFVLPLILKNEIAQGYLNQQWHFYLALIFFSFLGMIPLIFLAERKNITKFIFLGAVGITALSQLFLAFTFTQWTMVCGLIFLYFVAFNVLEAIVPSLISKHAGIKSKGTAMGIYSSSQFLGIFAGGVLAGFLYQYAGIHSIFLMNAIFALFWFAFILGLKPNAYETTLIIASPYSQETLTILEKLKGVKEVLFSQEESIFYLRVNKQEYREGSAEILIRGK